MTIFGLCKIFTYTSNLIHLNIVNLKYSNTTINRLDWNDMFSLVRNFSYIYLLPNFPPTQSI